MHQQESLFGNPAQGSNHLTDPTKGMSKNTPLADRVRPRTLDEFVGQQNLLGKGQLLRTLIVRDRVPDMILWGPPGCGKTTLAEIIARHTKSTFLQFSAADASIRRIKILMRRAEEYRRLGKKVIVFIDEIHRFNKSQQDAFLPYTEKGSITLIGATTENPSFTINSALLSRCKVFVFHQLTTKDVETLIKHALKSPNGFNHYHVKINDKQIELITKFANGDARKALNTLAMAVDNGNVNHKTVMVTNDSLKQLMGRRFLLYDKKGDQHYDLISALHKSVRNSDVNSAIYWMYRMLEGGDDPVYIARRMIRMSSEDVGLADPGALTTCVNAFQVARYLGMPECRLALVEAIVRLALDPKSNSLLKAGEKAEHDVKKTMNLPVPLQIRNAPTKLMNKLGYGEHYKYAENYQDHITAMRTMPKKLVDRQYYYPTDFGLEGHFKNRMKQIAKVKAWHRKHGDHKLSQYKPMDLNQFDQKHK
ncbi:replication-associated recombination protein A [Acetilactobacillus jinshanensis]|uniref:Replication-associated recombination protein A n=1 Tax=Acetilactobacillus jinshanensis TaxID=1720083 RepID=A0A4P6ZKY9_9LACO|nr:replication-associated recombination protein A [Acetilactobacillus jinshanensis]URL61065.1 replication-associated recombination protein A [uncultured bacterium]